MAGQDAAAPIVVTVAYRADDHLQRCLSMLKGEFEVVVVDNAAAASTRALAQRMGARYLANPRNLGFAAAVNIGLATRPSNNDVLLLNPDAELSAAGVRALQVQLHRTGARHAAVGARLCRPDGAVEPSSWPIPSPGQVWMDACGLGRFWRGNRFVTGAVLMLHGDALVELGGLDERYFLYAEEADWQLRALRAGWSVAVAAEVTAVHVGGASSNDPAMREKLFHASGRTFARRWYGRTGAAVMWLGSVVAAGRRSVLGGRAARAGSRRALRMHLHLHA